MIITFEEAIERVLGHEGGYVNDPEDPGGETKWGISKRSYPHLDIRALTREQAKELYRTGFWNPVLAFISDNALKFQMLDAAVNHGMGNAVRILQRALDVADDGHFGPISRAVLAALPIADVHLRFISFRIRFFTKLSTFPRFGRGWMERVAQDLIYLAKDN
jgi:lysozyme family protein